jgi:acetolactate synthase-1/2/3 large subunit
MEHKGPFLIEFMVEPEENVYPFVPPGKTIVEFLELPDPAASLKK